MNIMNFSEGARALGVSHQRFSRLARAANVETIRSGYTLIFNRLDLRKIRAKLEETRKKTEGG